MVELLALIESCAPNVHPVTMSAIVQQESGGNPFAMNANYGDALPRLPENPGDATALAQELLDRQINFDSGLGQINSENWDWLGLDASSVFDPCENLEAAQRVLADCYKRATDRFPDQQRALQAALSCYNTGNFSAGFDNGYVADVLAQVASIESGQIPALRGNSSTGGIVPTEAGDTSITTNNERLAEGASDVFSSGEEDAFSRSTTKEKELAEADAETLR